MDLREGKPWFIFLKNVIAGSFWMKITLLQSCLLPQCKKLWIQCQTLLKNHSKPLQKQEIAFCFRHICCIKVSPSPKVANGSLDLTFSFPDLRAQLRKNKRLSLMRCAWNAETSFLQIQNELRMVVQAAKAS